MAEDTTHDFFSLKLDPSIYPLTSDKDPEATAFYKAATKIEDEEELKRHVLAIQEESFKVCSYVDFWHRVEAC